MQITVSKRTEGDRAATIHFDNGEELEIEALGALDTVEAWTMPTEIVFWYIDKGRAYTELDQCTAETLSRDGEGWVQAQVERIASEVAKRGLPLL